MASWSKQAPRSEAEMLARTRLLCGFVGIYLLSMLFLLLVDQIYGESPYAVFARLATIPFALLLVLRGKRLVRVRPPAALSEARQLAALGRPRAAREKMAQLLELPAEQLSRVDRSRRLLQDGLAVGLRQQALVELGRFSMELGELERAAQELEQAYAELPQRADVALDLAEVLLRLEAPERAAQVLEQSLPYLDACDRATLEEQPQLRQLLRAPLPQRSAFAAKLFRERLLLAGLVLLAAVHGLHFYLGLF